MDNAYYSKKQIIATVDKKGNTLGKIDKWHAHKNGILHRGYLGILIYKNYFVIQHRKHPAFDGVLDLSFASHQIFENGKFQEMNEAFFKDLKREMNLNKKDILGKLKYLGFIYYKEKDRKSIYTEHEICDVLIAKINKLPNPNLDFAYGYSLATKDEILKKGRIYEFLSPWAKEIVDLKMI
ncbi:MAG: hypothetical protein A3I49_00185 [Candidatus Levybacteria bacterium RIFCSPLOWO2_02_FULL_37_11]|nr:MAG: hypothetical protein A3I49_00185 [Candidatus Levybacteria bacterium RIFCSPLOWO2_02_FULL_37_11]